MRRSRPSKWTRLPVDWTAGDDAQCAEGSSARQQHKAGLLAIEDITERRRIEDKRAAAHKRIAALLQELGHRIKNSLQIIASMVSLEARNHKSGEGKAALERVSHRITALGRLYSILGEPIRPRRSMRRPIWKRWSRPGQQ